jgi:branched-subunit amino acid aminotransferase/4-amino-4-deoxychorismate lyase
VTEPLVYLNGRMLPPSEAHLKIYDAGVVLGATVTEQVRTFGKRLYKLDEHVDRLWYSLRSARIDIGLTRGEVTAISQELVAHHAGFLDDDAELGLIQFVTAGEYAAFAGLPGAAVRAGPTVCVHTFPLPFERWARKMQLGAHLVTPSIRHVPPSCYDPKMKYRSRMHFYLADKEAQQTDADAAALLLDLHGNVTETATANFLIVERGAIVSPSPANILPGISRATVIELANRLGIRFVERDITVDDALRAAEAFTTSTPYCLMPVTKLNGITIGDGKPGPVFGRLLEAWSRQVGVDIAKQIVEGATRRL